MLSTPAKRREVCVANKGWTGEGRSSKILYFKRQTKSSLQTVIVCTALFNGNDEDKGVKYY